jgi:hypothetical protein
MLRRQRVVMRWRSERRNRLWPALQHGTWTEYSVTSVPVSRDALRDETKIWYIALSFFVFLLDDCISSESLSKSKSATSASACTFS